MFDTSMEFFYYTRRTSILLVRLLFLTSQPIVKEWINKV